MIKVWIVTWEAQKTHHWCKGMHFFQKWKYRLTTKKPLISHLILRCLFPYYLWKAITFIAFINKHQNIESTISRYYSKSCTSLNKNNSIVISRNIYILELVSDFCKSIKDIWQPAPTKRKQRSEGTNVSFCNLKSSIFKGLHCFDRLQLQ